jgi:hypothetical protein
VPCVEYNVRAVELLFFCHRRYKADDELKFSFSFFGGRVLLFVSFGFGFLQGFWRIRCQFSLTSLSGRVHRLKRLLLEYCTVLYSLDLYGFFTDITTLQGQEKVRKR